MFPIFAAHAAPGARLLFTSGHEAGDNALGRVGDSTVYHASLSPREYRDLLSRHGFRELWYRPQDAELRGHTIWLAEFSAA